MKTETKEEIRASVKDYHLPRYNEIPNIGLFLEQVSKYIEEYLRPLGNITLTSSMISNYVKMKLLDNPVKKQYSRDQIARLFFIAIAKSVLSLDDIRILLNYQKEEYSIDKAYNYFCGEFENVLFFVFSLQDVLGEVGEEESDEKVMLRYAIITIVNKIYLDKCFATMSEISKKDQ